MERRTRVSVYEGGGEKGGGEGGNYAGNDGKYKPGEFHRGMYPVFGECGEREYKYGESEISLLMPIVLVSNRELNVPYPRRIFRWRPSDEGINLRLGGNRRLDALPSEGIVKKQRRCWRGRS